jgi:serine/threonine-protein kinase
MPELRPSAGAILDGKYSLLRLLGEGGMGAVYEGCHLEIGKRVAIKVLSPHLAQSEEAERRFRREARAASAVESEHIVQVFDVGRDVTVGLFMVMELLSGEDLQRRLDREGPLPVDVAADIACQTLRALSKAHAAGVIHRDLKPANLFLAHREAGSLLVKLLDFGVSKLLLPTAGASVPPQAPALTRIGAAVGTPQYMSPEQAQGLDNVDHRTDVWSLGAVLHEALSGKPAYPDMPTYEQTIVRIVTQHARPLREDAPWVPESLATVVDQMLQHEPDQRISVASALAAMVAWRGMHVRGSIPDDPGGVDAPVPVPMAPPMPSRRFHTSAAVVLNSSPPSTTVENSDLPAPRASDLPGVRASRKAVAAVGVALLALLGFVGLVWAWPPREQPVTSTGLVAWAPASTVSATTPPTALEASVVVLPEGDRPMDHGPSPLASASATRQSGAESRPRQPRTAAAASASATIKAPPKQPDPPPKQQYGGAGLSDAY